jgi:hypothetical protein
MTAFWSFQSPFFASNDSRNLGEYFSVAYVRVSSATHTLSPEHFSLSMNGREKGNNDQHQHYGVAINGRCSGFGVGYFDQYVLYVLRVKGNE